MSREKELIKNTGIITIGRVCTQMISFFLLPLYTAVFSTTEFGIVDLFNTIVALLVPILTIQIEQALFRFLIDARESEEDKSKLISSAFILITIGIAVYTLIFMCIAPLISNEYKYYLLINVLATILSTLMLQVARGLGRNTQYSIGSFIVAGFTVILNVLFIVVLKLGVSGMFLAIFIANMLATIYLLISNKTYKHISFKMFSGKLLKAMIKYAAALIPNAISWWVINVSDRTIISSMISVAANGIYAAANKFSGMYINAYNIFNVAWTESASVHINDHDKDEYFSKTINTAFKVFGCFALIIIGVTPFVFPLLINTKFVEAYNQIPLLMLSSLFNVGVGLISAIYVAMKRTKDISKTSFFAAIINIVVNVTLIKHIGLYAAAISTMVAYLAMFIYRAIDCRKYVKLKWDTQMLIAMFIAFVVTFTMYYININWLNVVMLGGVIVFSVLYNRNSFQSIRKILARKFSKGES